MILTLPDLPEASFELETRNDWHAAAARSRHTIPTPTPILYLHHSVSALDSGGNGVWWDDVKAIQRFHMNRQWGRGWSDIAYSFLIGGGQAFEGRGVGIAGGHTAGQNTVSHAICLIGDYTWMAPTAHDLEAIAQLYAHGIHQGWWLDRIEPHRDAPGASTTCCGDKLVAKLPWIRERAQQILTPGDDDMTARIITAYIAGGRPRDRITWTEVCVWVDEINTNGDEAGTLAYITWAESQKP